jgi:hypothetical protein
MLLIERSLPRQLENHVHLFSAIDDCELELAAVDTISGGFEHDLKRHQLYVCMCVCVGVCVVVVVIT